jgi:hypothetical protein
MAACSIIILIIVTIGSAALVGLGLLKKLSPATSILDFRPRIVYNPVSLRLPLPRQSILISVIASSLVI